MELQCWQRTSAPLAQWFTPVVTHKNPLGGNKSPRTILQHSDSWVLILIYWYLIVINLVFNEYVENIFNAYILDITISPYAVIPSCKVS